MIFVRNGTPQRISVVGPTFPVLTFYLPLFWSFSSQFPAQFPPAHFSSFHSSLSAVFQAGCLILAEFSVLFISQLDIAELIRARPLQQYSIILLFTGESTIC